MNKLPDTHRDPDNYRDGDGNGNATIDMGAYEYDAPPWVGIDDIELSKVFLKFISCGVSQPLHFNNSPFLHP